MREIKCTLLSNNRSGRWTKLFRSNCRKYNIMEKQDEEMRQPRWRWKHTVGGVQPCS